jgi:hypothetical protein
MPPSNKRFIRVSVVALHEPEYLLMESTFDPSNPKLLISESGVGYRLERRRVVDP